MTDSLWKDRSLGTNPGVFSSLNTIAKPIYSLSPVRRTKKNAGAVGRIEFLAQPKKSMERSMETKTVKPYPVTLSARPLGSSVSKSAEDFTLRNRSLIRASNGEELETANSTVRRLNTQLTIERKTESDLGQSFRKREELYQLEIFKLKSDLSSLQIALQKAKGRNSAIHSETDRLQYAIQAAHQDLSFCKGQFQELTQFLIQQLEESLFADDPKDSPSDHQVEAVRETLLLKLEEVAQNTRTDLGRELSRVSSWLQVSPDTPHTLHKQPSAHSEISTMQQIPFDDIGSSRGPSLATEDNDIGGTAKEAQELEIVKRNILQRIASTKTSSEGELAVALFDFPGEQVKYRQEGDLQFCRGDHILVLKKDPQGWWLGEREGVVGVFPYNYVQGLL